MLRIVHLKLSRINKCVNRFYSTGICQENIRNIGVLAHIDAGKTTTTERMLFYSGKIRLLGEVHHGNTVTDYLTQERERGITICSCAVTFPWREYRINLLDTPGHIDFTMEVEQSLGAVDGAVIILDGSAGVEAQTITVWEQANRHKLPRIVFVNKMDRMDADLNSCLSDLQSKLHVTPLPLQYPSRNNKSLQGVIDVINLTELIFDKRHEGKTFKIVPLTGDLLEDMQCKRNQIIDLLSEHDDKLANNIIENNSLDNITNEQILSALRNATIKQQIVPVLLGSAYKNTGVQPLMDAVINFLPSPTQRNEIFKCFGSDFAGKVFKVTHDKQRGPLSLVRVLNGKLRTGAKITTWNGLSEQIKKMYEPLADEYREINEIETGDVGVLVGLKTTSTGDLIASSQSSIKNAQKKFEQIFSDKRMIDNEIDHSNDIEFHSNVFDFQPNIPDAVYFCSIEPPSLSYQLPLENALKQLQREDPSLRVTYDETTMQTVLGGMGELHLDIIKSRILSEYKIEADLGPLQIAYKEELSIDNARNSLQIEKEIAGNKQFIIIDISLVKDQNTSFKLDSSPEATENLKLVRPRYLSVIKKAALMSLERGPLLSSKIINTQVILHGLTIGKGTADSFIMSAVNQCIQKILLSAGCKLLEPIMILQIVTSIDKISQILGDLGKRRSTILDITTRGENNKVINALAPLAELSGYASSLRSISSGTANMSMQPHGYALMEPYDEALALRRAQGLE